ncbi:MAG TPA: diacylglycerol kinase family protein [Pelobium sp.]
MIKEEKSPKFSLKQRLASFKYALHGFKVLLKYEHNARLHLLFAGLAVWCGWFLNISLTEWALLSFAIALVFITEILNTCIEEICDFVCAENNLKIKKIKDLAALAVLIAAVASITIGLFIFLPKIF